MTPCPAVARRARCLQPGPRMLASTPPNSDRRVAVSSVAAILSAIALTPGCGTHCTLIGWQEGMTVELSPSLYDVGDGRYRIEVVADGEVVEVVFDLTRDGTTCVQPVDDCHYVARELADGRRLDVQVGPYDVTAGYSDDGPAGGPDTLTVTVARGDRVINTATYTPTYDQRELNGRGCGVATTARATLRVL